MAALDGTVGEHVGCLGQPQTRDVHAPQQLTPPEDLFDPPYTTFDVATVSGGQAINIVPRRAQLTWEYRPVPSDDGDAIREQVERFNVRGAARCAPAAPDVIVLPPSPADGRVPSEEV